MRTIKVTVEIPVPEGATHYGGTVLCDPVWYKCKLIGGFDHWFYYDAGEWLLHGHSKPHWCKEIEDDVVISKGGS